MEQQAHNPQGKPQAVHDESAAHTPSNGDQVLAKLRAWRLGRQFTGWGYMAIGVAGLVLPVLPGWIFIALGAVTLAPDVPFFARLLDQVAQRVPPLRNAIARVRGVAEN